MDFTVIQGDTLAIAGTAESGGSPDMTGWAIEGVLRKEPSQTALGEVVLAMTVGWADAATGTWEAEGDTAALPLGRYHLHVTFVDAGARRFTPPHYTVQVTA